MNMKVLLKLLVVLLFVMSLPLSLSAAKPDLSGTNKEAPKVQENKVVSGKEKNNNNSNPNVNSDNSNKNIKESVNAQVNKVVPGKGNNNNNSNPNMNSNNPNKKGEESANNNANLNPNANKVPEKSFKNSVQGSKDFVQNMLDLVYTELPKKNNNQEVFDYLALITTEYFAFNYMSEWTVGRDVIRSVPENLQEKYFASSKEFMILLYGEIFNAYYKQYTYKLGEVERKSDTQYSIKMEVGSKVQDSKNQDTILNVVWKVKYSEKEKRFFVIDVDVNGIIFLVTQKKQFTEMLKSQNYDFTKFLSLLDAKNMDTKKRLGIVLTVPKSLD